MRTDEQWPFYAEDEIAAVADVLRSGKVNQWTGPDVTAFVAACERRFGGGRGLALANGSLALEIVLRAYGVGPGDEVVVSPRSFMASASSASLVGATPVFADVDADSGNITPNSIARVLTDRTRAIIPVHLAGWPADIQGMMDLVDGRDVVVIEDCAQAHGAMIGGQSVGSIGHAAAFSFCQDKIISTGGEGGYVSFQDEAKWRWAWSFKDHGKDLDKATSGGGTPGMFRYVHDSIGTNWRLTGPQAAIGMAQLGKLDRWTDRRTRNARIWIDALDGIPRLRVPLPDPHLRHAFYKLYFYIEGGSDDDAAEARATIIGCAQAEGLRLFSGSCSEIYLEQAFADLPRPDCPVSRSLGARSLMVEVHPTLQPDLLERRAARLAEMLRAVLGGA
ncbi:DegT/DnrJ/EryC1/StrS aminotransferase family protein [Sphingomonas sabuli]|uniref:DegT/DnrJ/EryC1/StrS aminotransferase family protein n=1 Tax=Sphingomonas sabuli TaxID=2764186 RepID=A0A7G9L5S7_9SPHN|nr:DegT/DnrJ/EryC1/StrS aminotransferase family protein [Sphingomonas sabuli]